MKWESPRGPISIDRKVEKKNGQFYNVEFATFTAIEDLVRAAKK
jgi:branched-chain amino acid transport system substrate-binding protein